jgi:hypothetical protein
MSDYLGNLIARTVSPAVAVRPRLPSLFEPAPATREGKSEPEFEQENFMEQPPVTRPSEKLAPMPLSIPTPRQSMFREPEQTVPEISRPRKILETSQESQPASPAKSIRHQSTPREPSRIVSRRGDDKSSPEPEAPVQPRIFRGAAPTLREDKRSNSTGRRADVIKSPRRDVIASASHEVGMGEQTRPSQPSVASKPVVVPELRKHELLKSPGVRPVVPTVHSLPPIAPLPPTAATAKPVVAPELRKHQLLKWSGVRPVVPTVRSLPPIAPLPPTSATAKPVVAPELRNHELLKWSGVRPIVPTVRSLLPIAPLSPAAVTAKPTINVTIGRVEIRAVSPPAQERAKPKPATVLSLEDYLRRRAKGAA